LGASLVSDLLALSLAPDRLIQLVRPHTDQVSITAVALGVAIFACRLVYLWFVTLLLIRVAARCFLAVTPHR
jgi:hypothetical protein